MGVTQVVARLSVDDATSADILVLFVLPCELTVRMRWCFMYNCIIFSRASRTL